MSKTEGPTEKRTDVQKLQEITLMFRACPLNKMRFS